MSRNEISKFEILRVDCTNKMACTPHFGFDSHWRHISERFFPIQYGPGYPHRVCSELEKSGIRMSVEDCSVTECRRWRPPYQTGKTVYVHAKYYKHNEDGRVASGVCGRGSVPLSDSGNVVTRTGLQ